MQSPNSTLSPLPLPPTHLSLRCRAIDDGEFKSIMRGVLRTLSALHTHRIAHGLLVPANIRVTDGGSVFLCNIINRFSCGPWVDWGQVRGRSVVAFPLKPSGVVHTVSPPPPPRLRTLC